MTKVKEIVNKTVILRTDDGYIAIFDNYQADGGTRNEAVNNLLDLISIVERTWPAIEGKLLANNIKRFDRSLKRVFGKRIKIGMN